MATALARAQLDAPYYDGSVALRPCPVPGCPILVKAGRCPTHARAVSRRRLQDEPGRAWYQTARWKALRKLVLSEEPLCRISLAKGQVVPATEVDHIEPHRGSEALFWSRENLQGLSASEHSKKTRRGE